MDLTSGRSGVGSEFLVDEIERDFGRFVCVKDNQESSPSASDDNSDEDGSEELEPYGPELVKESKCADNLFGEEDDEPDVALQQLFSEGPILPSVPLVSAMKGSREKLGAPPVRLTVKWAPDVYDPIPNSLSHSVKSKQKKSRKDRDKESNNNYKKNGKKGQKGKGGGGKDKKQLRKASGRSDKGYKTLTCDSGDLDGFNVGSPDYCGSSFLKSAPTNFHYSVAEAL